MKLVEVGEIIAVRKLTLAPEEDPGREGLALLGEPKQLLDRDDFYFPYQIKGARDERV